MWYPREVPEEAGRLWPREPTVKWVTLAKDRWQMWRWENPGRCRMRGCCVSGELLRSPSDP